MLANAIDRAWLGHKIPTVAQRWIVRFMSGRRANIGFDDYLTEVARLDSVGLAQSSLFVAYPLRIFQL